ncbi:Malate/lactate/ureidoglycolate dehydrogenase, LDH2 family [Lentibacillus halodurans]|uniref:Malate/lactate/ureidoglycolate dehydrogenase, LDH2 family n=1 Tax=Lentibacillus halodurans TaxID=237679 RepID=A0A1I0XMG8_9BACI|nr:Ldh family oxidoreductase [Lentibacillus halodurans]SFB01388.1 Malate/lactate/ureidoglycolate dehydrogenase, LDH2 family [Lentibacillus halodurans]
MNNEYIISHTDYIEMGTSILEKAGVPNKHAFILMNNFLDCDEKGIFTHGFIRLPTYLKQMERGNINPRPEINFLTNDPIVNLLDGEHGLGAVVSYYAMQKAIETSEEYGIGVVGVRNSSHFGAAAYYTEMASNANQIGISFTNASPGIAPTGSVKPLLGNNPWSISVPTHNAYPITMDIANSVVARGKIRVANARGESIPIEWALNKFGQQTTDPKEALDGGAILPIGGYKGYGITLMIEMLTGVLTGSGFGYQNAAVEADGKRRNGHLFISLKIEKFMEVAEFKGRVDVLLDMIKSLPKIDEDKEIFLPGEIEWNRKSRLEKGTVKISEEIYAVMKELSIQYTVNMPTIKTEISNPNI